MNVKNKTKEQIKSMHCREIKEYETKFSNLYDVIEFSKLKKIKVKKIKSSDEKRFNLKKQVDCREGTMQKRQEFNF